MHLLAVGWALLSLLSGYYAVRYYNLRLMFVVGLNGRGVGLKPS